MISLNYFNEQHLTDKVTGKKIYIVKQALFDIFCLFYKQNPDNAFNENIIKKEKNLMKKLKDGKNVHKILKIQYWKIKI